MTVSVVVPTYESAATVARTLDSVLAQTHADLEVVVADHSSRDGTQQVLDGYRSDPRLRVLDPTPAGGGAARNWNRVTDAATGDLLKLVCADDVLHPTCVARQVEALDQHPSAGLVAVQRDLVDKDDRPLLRARGLGGLRGLVPGADAVRAVVRAGSNLLGEPVCVLLRTELLRAAGGWTAEQPYLIDLATYAQVLRRSDLVALPEPLAAFRVSKGQWSVELAADQARQARAWHRRAAAEVPGISARDVRLGDLQALRVAAQRRAAYLVWRGRM